MPSSSSRRRHRRRGIRRRAAREERERIDFSALPVDVLLNVFGRLDHIDVLMAADQVCSTWWRAARDEPSLWRRITMRGTEELATRINRRGMACAAVRRAAGLCETFCGEHFGDDGFLVYLAEQAPYLKSLRLISCSGVSNNGIEQVKEFPQLEELELSLCTNVTREAYAIIGTTCPQLKSFKLNKQNMHSRFYGGGSDADVLGIATMHELRSLQLFSNSVTNLGLAVILDNCPHLEALDIRYCFNIDMDDTLRVKCAEILTLKLPCDSTDDCDFPVDHSLLRLHNDCVRYMQHSRTLSDVDSIFSCCFSDNYEYEDDDDDYSCPSRYEEDLDKYDWVLPRSMRKFQK